MKIEDLKWFKSSRKPVFHQKRISHSGFTSTYIVYDQCERCAGEKLHLFSRVGGRSENSGVGASSNVVGIMVGIVCPPSLGNN